MEINTQVTVLTISGATVITPLKQCPVEHSLESGAPFCAGESSAQSSQHSDVGRQHGINWQAIGALTINRAKIMTPACQTNVACWYFIKIVTRCGPEMVPTIIFNLQILHNKGNSDAPCARACRKM